VPIDNNQFPAGENDGLSRGRPVLPCSSFHLTRVIYTEDLDALEDHLLDSLLQSKQNSTHTASLIKGFPQTRACGAV